MNVHARARIRALNDQLRRQHTGGEILLTPGVTAQGQLWVVAALEAIATFDSFSPHNDPYGEHDFGSLVLAGATLFWKIDYYDHTLTSQAVDPADPSKCVRVMTVMLTREY